MMRNTTGSGPFGTEWMSCGDPHIDQVLAQLCGTCLRLEELSIELDRGQRELEVLMRGRVRHEGAIDALRRRMEGTMAEIVRIETEALPELMRAFRELGSGSASAALLQRLHSRLAPVVRASELSSGPEPAGEESSQASPWEVA